MAVLGPEHQDTDRQPAPTRADALGRISVLLTGVLDRLWVLQSSDRVFTFPRVGAANAATVNNSAGDWTKYRGGEAGKRVSYSGQEIARRLIGGTGDLVQGPDDTLKYNELLAKRSERDYLVFDTTPGASAVTWLFNSGGTDWLGRRNGPSQVGLLMATRDVEYLRLLIQAHPDETNEFLLIAFGDYAKVHPSGRPNTVGVCLLSGNAVQAAMYEHDASDTALDQVVRQTLGEMVTLDYTNS